MDAGVTDPNTVFDGGSVDTGVKVEECLDDLFSLEKSWSGSVVFETLLTVCVCVCASVLATVLMFYVWYYLVCMSSYLQLDWRPDASNRGLLYIFLVTYVVCCCHSVLISC